MAFLALSLHSIAELAIKIPESFQLADFLPVIFQVLPILNFSQLAVIADLEHIEESERDDLHQLPTCG